MKSKFLSNKTEQTFLFKIKESLEYCTSFYFSVSFIKRSGLSMILKHIDKALARGAIGKVITSTYQNFTDIFSLNEFMSLMEKYNNFECHLDYQNFVDGGFHSKGYLFEFNDHNEIIIGSSNLTLYALTKNIEWNILIESKDELTSINDAKNEFIYLFHSTEKLSYDLINKYKSELEYAIFKWDMDLDNNYISIKPNYMQRSALKEIRRYRDLGENKTLIIAATGSGKTFLAAFDAKNFNPKKLLFVVHRETILNDALQTFRKVFGSTKSYGLYTGSEKDTESDFIFSTNISISNNLDKFDPQEFDYIIIDEVHHAVAITYTKIINHFKPTFLLGLTATPIRMDGGDVLGLFERNIPYELNLREALINNLVVPFKYYGIKLNADYSGKDVRKFIKDTLNQNNIDEIVFQINKHNPKSGKLKIICFCRSVGHANQMSEELSDYFITKSLTGVNSVGERLQTFKDLQNEFHPLNIIFTVDILNEGIDIPGINMVIFLRPTESQVVFIQQLGRGLRKYQGKEHLTILDFIGNNYERSVQIAGALGTLSNTPVIEKTLLISLVKDNFKQLNLPGVEICFDEISKDEIIKNINNTNFNRTDIIIKDYNNFKAYINSPTYLSHMDFFHNELAPDIMRLINSKFKSRKNASLYKFLLNIGEDVPELDGNEVLILNELSDILPIVRPYEYEIIKELLDEPQDKENIITNIKEKYDNFSERQFEHAFRFLSNKLFDDEIKNSKFKHIIKMDNKYGLAYSFDNRNFRIFLEDLLEYGLCRYKEEFGDSSDDFVLYKNYSIKQAKMVMLKPGLMEMKGTVFGDNGNVYLFVNLNKEVKREDLDFLDIYKSYNKFQWESETGTTINNTKGIKLLTAKKAFLFLRKVQQEDGITLPFTFMGTGKFTNPRKNNENKSDTLLFDLVMDNEVPENLRYDFNVPEEE